MKNTLKTLTLALTLVFTRTVLAEADNAFEKLQSAHAVDFENGIPADIRPAAREKKSRILSVHAEKIDLYKNPSTAFQINPVSGLKKHAQTAAAILDVSAERNNADVNFNTVLLDHALFDFNEDSLSIIRKADILTISSYQSLFYPRPPFDIRAADEIWDRSKAIVITGLPNNDAPGMLSPEGFNPIDRGDTVIRTLSYKNAKLELSPDVIYQSAFEEGFCYPFVPTLDEINQLFVGKDVPELAKDNKAVIYQYASYYKSNGGKPMCDLEGNSFASPNLGGLAAAYSESYPDLNEHEITVALLTSARIVGKPELYAANARGLYFGEKYYGFGLVLKEEFRKRLDTLREIHRQNPDSATQPLRSTETMRVAADGKSLTAAFNSKTLALRTMGVITVKNDPKLYRPSALRNDPEYAMSVLPSEAKITSPSGTTYRIKLHAEAWSLQHPENGLKLGFATAGFLGENTEGEWTVEIPLPAKSQMKIISGEFTIAGLNSGGTVDQMINTITKKAAVKPAASQQRLHI